MTTTPSELIAEIEASGTVRTTACGDGRMVWRVWGDGTPTVLLHGGHGSWLHWIRNIPRLSRGRMVIVPDMPGYGESDLPPQQPPSASGHGEVLARGIEDLLGSDNRKIALVGFSLGGAVAAFTADRLGDRVETVVLVGPAGLGRPHPPHPELLRWRELPDVNEQLAVHRHNLAALMLHDPASIDALAMHVQVESTLSARIQAGTMMRGQSIRECLARTPARLVGIWGERDILVGPHMAARHEFIQQLQPGAAFDVIEGAGHWAPYEAADAFNTALEDALG